MLSTDMALKFDEINIMVHKNVSLKRDVQYILVCCLNITAITVG
jgi:hypothetical protein